MFNKSNLPLPEVFMDNSKDTSRGIMGTLIHHPLYMQHFLSTIHKQIKDKYQHQLVEKVLTITIDESYYVTMLNKWYPGFTSKMSNGSLVCDTVTLNDSLTTISKLPPLTIPLNSPTYKYLIAVQYEILFNIPAMFEVVQNYNFDKLVPMLLKLQKMSSQHSLFFEFTRVLGDKPSIDELWKEYLNYKELTCPLS